MKQIMTLLLFTIGISSSYSQNKDFNITITDIKLNSGKVFVAISNKEEDWLEKPFKTITIESDKKTKTVTFKVPFDIYAISVYQDVIQNDEPDMNFLGAPKEPVAFGNNYKPFMGEPKFRKSKVMFNESYKTQVLKLY